MVLLVGAGLMVRTLARMQQVALPFDPSRILTMRVPLPETRYPAVEDRARFLTTLLERVEGIPGVRSAAVNSGLPFLGARGTRITLPGRSPIDQPSLVHETTASYLRILRARADRGTHARARRRHGRPPRRRRQSGVCAAVFRQRLADRADREARLPVDAARARHRQQLRDHRRRRRHPQPGRAAGDLARDLRTVRGQRQLRESDSGGGGPAAAARSQRAGAGLRDRCGAAGHRRPHARCRHRRVDLLAAPDSA